jgi:hypothetical protein
MFRVKAQPVLCSKFNFFGTISLSFHGLIAGMSSVCARFLPKPTPQLERAR